MPPKPSPKPLAVPTLYDDLAVPPSATYEQIEARMNILLERLEQIAANPSPRVQNDVKEQRRRIERAWGGLKDRKIRENYDKALNAIETGEECRSEDSIQAVMGGNPLQTNSANREIRRGRSRGELRMSEFRRRQATGEQPPTSNMRGTRLGDFLTRTPRNEMEAGSSWYAGRPNVRIPYPYSTSNQRAAEQQQLRSESINGRVPNNFSALQGMGGAAMIPTFGNMNEAGNPRFPGFQNSPFYSVQNGAQAAGVDVAMPDASIQQQPASFYNYQSPAMQQAIQLRQATRENQAGIFQQRLQIQEPGRELQSARENQTIRGPGMISEQSMRAREDQIMRETAVRQRHHADVAAEEGLDFYNLEGAGDDELSNSYRRLNDEIHAVDHLMQNNEAMTPRTQELEAIRENLRTRRSRLFIVWMDIGYVLHRRQRSVWNNNEPSSSRPVFGAAFIDRPE